MIKSIIYTLFIAVALTSCNTSKDSAYHVTGEAPNVYNGIRVYLQELDAASKAVIIDTAIVMDEKFAFDNPVELGYPELRFITMDGTDTNFLFIQDSEKVHITTNKDSLWASKVKGSEQNIQLAAFKVAQMKQRAQAQEFMAKRNELNQQGNADAAQAVTDKWLASEKELREMATTIIKKNPDNIISSVLLGELVNMKFMDEKSAMEYYTVFSDKLKEAPLTKQMGAYLTKFTATEIGEKAPEFEALTPEGKPLKLSETLGKVTLIDFWASWCGPCRQENPNVVAAYQKYHDKGFNIISVSMDRPGADAAWKAAIEKDKMTWFHVSRLQYWDDPIAKMYNVTGIPATFLLDKDGVIIAKNLRGKDLHDKLAELLD
jgi:thiol-disulfide isomerase/thioredoxin